MAYNQSGLEAGLVHADNVNNPETRVIRGKNKFPQSFIHPSSCRYGEVDPVAAMKCERGDTFPYKFVTDLDTFTMKSPLKSKVNMYSAAFKVPMQAIYPRNWEIMLPTPNKGDDVPEDTRALFDPIRFDNFMSNFLAQTNGGTTKNNGFYPIYVLFVLLKESIFSDGSLFSKFNMHYGSFNLYRKYSDGTGSATFDHLLNGFDEWFDTEFVPWLRGAFEASFQLPTASNPFYHLKPIDDDDKRYFIVTDDERLIAGSSFGSTSISYISFRRALELLRTGEYDVNFGSYDFANQVVSWPFTGLSFSEDVNIEPIISYQLCCAHFFTNSKIDFVYSAQLWRDNMQSLLKEPQPTVFLYKSFFTWNGIQMQYDVFSSHMLNNVLYTASSGGISHWLNLSNWRPYMSFVFNLFSFQRSLRYGDYFTGAHTEPLAVGDINAPVVNGSVNALTMSRRIQWTRYLNKVNISGPRLEDWLRAVFGGKKPEAPKDVPIKLSVESFNVSGFEVNNTGDAQQNPEDRVIATTNLRLTDSKYMFEAEIEEPCWIIAVQYFDAHRIYSRTFDRFAFHKDRYDDFIPDFQFMGDQEVFLKELDSTQLATDLPFAYNLRYMEYKNRYSYASGLFVRKLRSWAFITDNSDGNPANRHIDPEYIRSSPSEFDRFYKSLSGYSLGTYAHFITFTTNVVSPYRQMVYAPEILA